MSKPVVKDEANIEESKQESEGASASTSKFSGASQYTDLNPIGTGQFIVTFYLIIISNSKNITQN
jgi:hypothetical protein